MVDNDEQGRVQTLSQRYQEEWVNFSVKVRTIKVSRYLSCWVSPESFNEDQYEKKNSADLWIGSTRLIIKILVLNSTTWELFEIGWGPDPKEGNSSQMSFSLRDKGLVPVDPKLMCVWSFGLHITQNYYMSNIILWWTRKSCEARQDRESDRQWRTVGTEGFVYRRFKSFNGRTFCLSNKHFLLQISFQERVLSTRLRGSFALSLHFVSSR
jgi:hypothetical protein